MAITPEGSALNTFDGTEHGAEQLKGSDLEKQADAEGYTGGMMQLGTDIETLKQELSGHRECLMRKGDQAITGEERENIKEAAREAQAKLDAYEKAQADLFIKYSMDDSQPRENL